MHIDVYTETWFKIFDYHDLTLNIVILGAQGLLMLMGTSFNKDNQATKELQ